VKLIISLIAIIYVCTGCVAPPVSAPSPVADPMALLRARQEHVHALATLAQVRMQRGGDSWSTTQALLVERPDHLRVDVVNFFGQVQMQLSIYAGQLAAYVPADKCCYRGYASSSNIEQFTGVDIPVATLVALILGQLPDGVLDAAVVSPCPAGVELYLGSNVAYVVLFENNRVKSVDYIVNNNVIYHVLYGHYNPESSFAEQVVFAMPLRDLSMSVIMEDVEINPAFDRTRFVLRPPAESEEVSLDGDTNGQAAR